MMIQYTIRVELLASKEDAGGYIVYAFKDLSNGTYKCVPDVLTGKVHS